jgi:hypothetical protein
MATRERRWNWGTGPRLAAATGTIVSLRPRSRLLAATLLRFSRQPALCVGPARWTQLAPPANALSSSHCTADWRRPDGYWACRRPAGHKGQHRMQGGLRP